MSGRDSRKRTHSLRRTPPKAFAPPPKFTVQTLGHQLIIFNAETWTFKECAAHLTRVDAQRECDALNGIVHRISEEPPNLHRRFREKGITPEDADKYEEDCVRANRLLRKSDLERQFIKSAQSEIKRDAEQLALKLQPKLPTHLKAWSVEIAAHFGRSKRRPWRIDEVIPSIKADINVSFTIPASRALHRKLWPGELWELTLSTERFAGTRQHALTRVASLPNEQRDLLTVHYSLESAPIKADYFAVSEREYYRQLNAAHLALAHCLIAPKFTIQPSEDQDQDETRGGDDDDWWWSLDESDLARFSGI